jgi:D-alanyl-D-alanine carboxypeptidase (penicillin-binding protein 5/6)
MARNHRRFISFLPTIVALIASLLSAPASSFAQTPPDKPSEPQISAASAIVVEYPSGRILYQKDAHHRMPPASLTKIMTAILALEYGNLNDVISVAPEDLAGESTMGLVAGEQQTLHDLLYGMLLPSGNDAAMAIARYLGSRLGSGAAANEDPVARFSDMMNMRLTQLGLLDTHFITPHGLDMPGHYSTAYDLASLAWYALHLPEFNEIVKTVSYDVPGHSLLNTNEMLTRYDGADGIKTGWTDGCGLCLVTSATRGGHRLISVVLNAPQWYSDSSAILDYGFAQLAATPSDPAAETLSIAKRDTVAWLLANPASSPPVAPAPKPEPAQPPVLAQGGGSASQPLQAKVAQPVQAALASDSNNATGSARAVAAVALPAGQSGPNFLLVVAIVTLLLSASCVVAARFIHLSSWAQFSRLKPFAFAGAGDVQPGADVAGPKVPAVMANFVPPARSSRAPVAPANALPVPRREPNLLNSPESDAVVHIARAVEHAAEGRQGSAMSEFMLALKAGADIDIADLAEQYRLSAGAFLALARAQVAMRQPQDARRTLLHGVLVMPGDRLLRLALYQLPPES